MRNIGIFVIIALVFWRCGGAGVNPGDQYFEKKQYKKAIEEYTILLGNNPQDVSSLYNRGRSYEEVGDLDHAEIDFTKVLDLDAKNLNANLSLAKINYEKKAYNKAVIFADKAIELNENSAQAHFLSARAKHQLGYVESAMESYTLAININKEYGEAFLYRGALKIHLKQTKSACSDIRRAVSLNVPEAKTILEKYCN